MLEFRFKKVEHVVDGNSPKTKLERYVINHKIKQYEDIAADLLERYKCNVVTTNGDGGVRLLKLYVSLKMLCLSGKRL